MGPGAFVYEDTNGRYWYLHSKNVVLRNGYEQKIYYFARVEDPQFGCDLPDGFEIVESGHSHMPLLKKS